MEYWQHVLIVAPAAIFTGILILGLVRRRQAVLWKHVAGMAMCALFALFGFFMIAVQYFENDLPFYRPNPRFEIHADGFSCRTWPSKLPWDEIVRVQLERSYTRLMSEKHHLLFELQPKFAERWGQNDVVRQTARVKCEIDRFHDKALATYHRAQLAGLEDMLAATQKRAADSRRMLDQFRRQ